MPIGFPPQIVYPLDIDSDYTLFLVYNTTEAQLTLDNEAWSSELEITPVGEEELEIWPDNGFANISGEMFYYDSVEKDSNGKVFKLKNCARNLGGKNTQFNSAGVWVRGFVVAEHHNQLVDVIIAIENFIGKRICDEENGDSIFCRLNELENEPFCSDDNACPDVVFNFEIDDTESDSNCEGIVANFNVEINGLFTNYRLDFGDGDFTTSERVGQHIYSPNSKIDPVVTVGNNRCQIVQTPIVRENPEEPQTPVVEEPFEIPIPEIPDFNFDIPDIIVPDTTLKLPPIIWPELDIGPIGPIGPISIPDTISIVPEIPSIITVIDNIPDVITIEVPDFGPISLDIPSFGPISFEDIPSFGPISFGPAPSFGPIEFGPPPTFDPIEFGPISFDPISVLSFAPIEFGPVPDLGPISFENVPSFGPISFGPAPTFGPINFGPAPTLGPIDFGPAPEFSPISVDVNGAPEFDPINFGPAPELGPIEFGPAPDIGPINFGPAPSFDPIEFGDAPSFDPIEFGDAPSFDPIEFGDAPSFDPISVDWGTPPTLSCNVTIECPGSGPSLRAQSYDENFIDSLENQNKIELEVGNFGIPSEILVRAPEFTDIKVIHDIPMKIILDAPKIPEKIEIIGPEIPIPKEIRLINDTIIPESIRLDITDLPRTLTLDASNMPTVISLELVKPLPESIKFDTSDLPDFIEVKGIPEFIELKGTLPSEILLKVPENIEVPLVYKGEPIPVQLDFKSLATEASAEGACFALVPCPKK